MSSRFFYLLLLILFLAILPLKTTEAGSPYAHLNGGLAISTGDQTTYYGGLGATAGYNFNKFFAVEATYSRLIPMNTSTSQKNAVTAPRLIARLPLWIVTPYATAGPGYFWSPRKWTVGFGAGALVDLWILNLSVGVDYIYVNRGDNLIVPTIGFGLSF